MNSSAFITGFTLGGTLIVAIGAQNAFVLRQGLRREHVLPVVIFCICADILLISAGVSGVGAAIDHIPGLTIALTLGGAAFLVWYASQALRNAFKPRALHAANGADKSSLRAVLTQAAAFTFLNPHVYLDTVLLMGSIGGRYSADLRLWFAAGASLSSFCWFSSLGFGARLLTPLFARPRAWQILDLLIGLTMLTLALALVAQTARAF